MQSLLDRFNQLESYWKGTWIAAACVLLALFIPSPPLQKALLAAAVAFSFVSVGLYLKQSRKKR